MHDTRRTTLAAFRGEQLIGVNVLRVSAAQSDDNGYLVQNHFNVFVLG
jgi:hypothetical protein